MVKLELSLYRNFINQLPCSKLKCCFSEDLRAISKGRVKKVIRNCGTGIKYIRSNRIFTNQCLATQPSVNKMLLIQPIATLKTYTYYDNISDKRKWQIPKRRNVENSPSIFDQIKKIYRETMSIKTRKVVLKKKPIKLESVDNEATIEAIIKQKWREANLPIKVDSTLSGHILRQADKRESADPNVSLRCSQHPYITCPLPISETYISNNACNNYKHTSLAPLFTLDPIIINSPKRKDANTKKCISVNFWNPFPNNNQNYCTNLITMQADTVTNNHSFMNKFEDSIKCKAAPLTAEHSTPKVNVEKALSNSTLNYEVEPLKNAHNSSNKLTFETGTSNQEHSIVKEKNTSIEESVNITDVSQTTTETEKKDSIRQIKVSAETVKKSEKQIEQQLLMKKKLKNIFQKNAMSNCNKQETKQYLNLNFPFQMTSPNLMKQYNNRTQVKNPKISDKIKNNKLSNQNKHNNKVNIPKYTSNKLLKRIQQFYEQDGLNNNINTLKNENASQSKIIPNNEFKSQYPLTSPSKSRIKSK